MNLASLMRLRALVRKEAWQIIRDPSSIAIALLLPVLLVILFGYGVSLDSDHVPIAIVIEHASAPATDVAGAFALSPYFAPRMASSMPEAERLLASGAVNGIVHFRENFARKLQSGPDPAQVQVIVNGMDANQARLVLGYTQGAVGQWAALHAAESDAASSATVGGPVRLQPRVWFNPELRSRYFLVPGLVALIVTLSGALLTALVMAREWERGTLESIFVTPVRAGEILLGKLIPYFFLGLCGWALTVAMAVFLLDVPLRGSLLVLLATSSVYLVLALGMGLIISSVTRNQFVAAQVAMVSTFLPTVLLSGMIFDIASAPAPVRLLTLGFPARYFVGMLQTQFLAGDVWGVILPELLILTVMAAIALLLTWRLNQKSLEH
jgi:ABC-2 type transport system permease protein